MAMENKRNTLNTKEDEKPKVKERREIWNIALLYLLH
jgi:hypothetical protein